MVQGVFDALTAEGSDYNQIKAMYAEYFEDIQWEEAVDGDSIVMVNALLTVWIDTDKISLRPR